MNQLIRFFPDTDLRNGHDGLERLAKKSGLSVNKLTPGQFVIFLNRRRTSLKMYAANSIIVHYRPPNDRKISLDVIRYIPSVFDGKDINYNEAVRRVLDKSLNL